MHEQQRSPKKCEECAQAQPGTSVCSELDGLVELGMKRQALRMARRLLKDATLSGEAFVCAVNAVQTFVDRLKPWTGVVESAYARLPQDQSEIARPLMVFFRNGCHDHEGVIQLTPQQFDEGCDLSDVAPLLESALFLGRMDLAAKLAEQVPRAIQLQGNPAIKTMLMQCQAEYLVRTKRCDEALTLLEAAQHESTLSQNAVMGIVEIHVARALTAIRQGFQLIERFNHDYDPEQELMLPGCDKAIQQDAARRFTRAQKILEKIVPKERQRELGIAKI